MAFLQAAKTLDVPAYIASKLFDKIGDVVDEKRENIAESEYGISSKYVKALKSSSDYVRDESGGTFYDDDCIKVIGSILRQYYKSQNKSALLVRQELVLLKYGSSQDLDTGKIAEKIFNAGIQSTEDTWDLGWNNVPGSIKSGLKIIIDSMVEEVKGSRDYLSLAIQVDHTEKTLLREIADVTDITKSNRESLVQFDKKLSIMLSRMEAIDKIGESNLQFDRDYGNTPFLITVSEVNDFYKNVLKLAQGQYNDVQPFLKICGKESIADAYIEPYYVYYGHRAKVKDWVAQIWTEDEQNYGVHFIKGNPGHGKSMFCMMSICDFLFKKLEHIEVEYDNVLWFSMGTAWYTTILDNTIQSVDENSSEAEILKQVRKIPATCRNLSKGAAMVFLDGYDDLLVKNSNINADFINQIRDALLTEIIKNELQIHVFITIRETSAVNIDENDAVTIDYLTREDREEWYKKRLNSIKDENEKTSLEKYWKNTFSVYNNSIEDTKIERIIGVPQLFRFIINYKIEDLKTAGKAYANLCHILFQNYGDEKNLTYYHERLAFEIYKSELNVYKKVETNQLVPSDILDYFTQNCPAKYFVQVTKDGKIDFSHEVFRDYFLANYFSRLFSNLSSNGTEDDVKNMLSKIAYWKFGVAQRNSVQMFYDLTENVIIEWKRIIDTMLSRLSVINSTKKNEDGTINQEHTDDGINNYSMREYCNIFCNTLSFFSIHNQDIELSPKNQERLSYLLKLFDCTGIILRACGSISKIDSQRALLTDSYIRNSIFEKWNFEGADFAGAKFEKVTFVNNNLTKCNFSKTEFSDVSFLNNSDLSRNTFDECKFTQVSFGINSFGIIINDSETSNAILNRCVIEGITFRNCTFEKVTFNNCNFSHAVFEHCTFSNVEFFYPIGLFASSFTKECVIKTGSQICTENGKPAYDFSIFDRQGRNQEESCIFAISIGDNRIMEEVKSFSEQDKDIQSFIKKDGFIEKAILEKIGYKEKADESQDIINDQFYCEIDDDYRMIHFYCGYINNYEQFSRNFLRYLEVLKEALFANNITNIHVFNLGPIFTLFYIGRVLGNGFNIHLYQYDRGIGTYSKVGVIAG